MNPKYKDNNEFIDFSWIIRECVAKWYVFAIAVAACGCLALLYTRIHEPEYMVKANLLITQDEDTGSGMGALSAVFGSSAQVDDEVFAVSSHSVFKKVAQELGVNQLHVEKRGFLKKEFVYPEYAVKLTCNPSIPDTLRTALLFKINVDSKGRIDARVKVKHKTVGKIKNATFPAAIETPYGEFILEKGEAYPQGEDVSTTIAFMGYDDAAEGIAKYVDVDIASRKSNVINMELESSNIDYAKAVLNNIIEQYNIRGLKEKNLRSQKTIDFIDSRLALLSGDLVESENTIENYKKENGIVDLSADASYQFSRKGSLESALVSSETEMMIVKMLKDFISDPQNKNELVPASLSMPGTQGIGSDGFIGAYNALILERLDLLQNAHKGNVTLANVERRIEAMRKNLLSTIDKTYESIQVKVKELRQQFNATQSALGNIPTQERHFRDISRQQSIKEQLYVYLLKQREQTSMLLANNQMKGQIIDEAYAVNEPLGLSKKMIFVLAIVAGIIFGALYIYLSRLLRTKFGTREELEKLTTMPVLGEVSHSNRGETLVVKPGGSTSVAELFRLIRTNLQFMLGGQTHKVIMITSTTAGEGKSFVSINLASSLALLGKKVLLMGLDIRKPKLQEYLGLPAAKGFTEYIADDSVKLDSIIQHNAVGNLDVVVSGPVPPNPSELLAEGRVDELFDTLREMYDYIVVDSAPVGIVSDTLTLERVSDVTVYVCRVNYTTKQQIHFANSLHDEGRLKKMSVVVNGTAPKQTYGYGDVDGSKKK